jgi:hypothetical protein
MPARRTALHGLFSAGFQKFTLTGTSVGTLNTTMQEADVLDISVETQNARYRADGTNPTAATGVLLVANSLTRLEGMNDTGLLTFISATPGAVVNVQGWKFEA